MAVKIPWKSLSNGNSFFSKWGPISTKWGTFSVKQAAFFAAVGLVIVVGIALRAGDFFGGPAEAPKAPVTIAAPPPSSAPATPAVQPAESVPKPQPPAQATTPAQETATAPNEQAKPTGEAAEQSEQAGEAVGQAEQPGLPDSGVILVSRRPVEVLSSPSPSASVMYGFPAGRQFRVIGRDGDFAQIKDVESGASGWINEAALAPPPRGPDVSAPSQSTPGTVGRTRAAGPADPKPRATKRDTPVTADSDEPVQPRKRPGLFGGDGPFRGIFGN